MHDVLHWLDVTNKVQFKLAVLNFDAFVEPFCRT